MDTDPTPISPKVYISLALGIVAAAVLWLITGDETFLVAILVPLVGAAGGVVAPAASGQGNLPPVTQGEVQRLAQVPPRDRHPAGG
jgi:di/tricarboxylate transporter